MEKQPTPVTGPAPETTLQDFVNYQIPAAQLQRLKGGDGGDPPPDSGIGHEDVLDL